MTEDLRAQFARVRTEVGKAVVGQDGAVTGLMIALLAGGHVVLEGVPGVAKTLLVRTLSMALRLDTKRIQFTPDLMPADIIGTNVVMQDATGRRYFQFERGPVFTQILLADEINRATPKTQSALLEAMQEHTVTAAGAAFTLEEPFFVMATQNPIEMEGTYPLPEAQLDRFLFKLKVEFPQVPDLMEIIDRTTRPDMPQATVVASRDEVLQMMRLAREVEVATHVRSFVARVVEATHPRPGASTMARRYVRYGSSPRGAQAMILSAKVQALMAGRANVSFGDLKALAAPSLRHRLVMNFEGEAEGIDSDAIVANVLEETSELESAKR